MSIVIADNFQYKGGKPIDARMKFASVANMVATPAADLYDGCFAYVTATKKYYSYDSSNTIDPTLSKWREFSAGEEYSDFTGATSQAAGAHGLVPTPQIADKDKFLKGDGTWAETTLPIASTSVLGGVKVGANLSINELGVLSASGGSGSEVEANPTGEPYETIYTIKINNDIYVIPQGGGSGGYVYTTMPACTSLDLGKVAQYVGATDNEYTKGFFYECVHTDNPYAYLVPIMTSATTPSGVVFCSGQGAGFEAYKVFGRDNNNRAWSLRNDNNPCWCGYQFNARTLVTDVDIYNYNRSDHQSAFEMPKTIEFQGSDDGINYATIQTFTIPTTVKDQKNSFSINDPSRYVYYRFYCTEFNDQTYCTMGRIDMFLYTGNYTWQKINVQ